MPTISIIVTIYNADIYLDRLLNSLINQTFKDLEIILIDDGSTDLSREICYKYQLKDERIKVFCQKNKGVAIARNRGLRKASGKYIGFVDSDDIISSEMYSTLYNNLIETNSDISVCNYTLFTNKVSFEYNNIIQIFTKEEALKDIISDGVITNFLWNKLFKRELFSNIKFPKKKIYEDLYVMPKLIEKTKKICVTNRVLYGYFKRSNSYVNSYNSTKNKNYLNFCNKRYKYLSKYEYLTLDLEKYKCFYIYSSFLQISKSRCKEVLNSKYMNNYYKIYRKNYHIIRSSYSYKRRLLFLLLYINKNIFYIVVNILR